MPRGSTAGCGVLRRGGAVRPRNVRLPGRRSQLYAAAPEARVLTASTVLSSRRIFYHNPINKAANSAGSVFLGLNSVHPSVIAPCTISAIACMYSSFVHLPVRETVIGMFIVNIMFFIWSTRFLTVSPMPFPVTPNFAAAAQYLAAHAGSSASLFTASILLLNAIICGRSIAFALP